MSSNLWLLIKCSGSNIGHKTKEHQMKRQKILIWFPVQSKRWLMRHISQAVIEINSHLISPSQSEMSFRPPACLYSPAFVVVIPVNCSYSWCVKLSFSGMKCCQRHPHSATMNRHLGSGNGRKRMTRTQWTTTRTTYPRRMTFSTTLRRLLSPSHNNSNRSSNYSHRSKMKST